MNRSPLRLGVRSIRAKLVTAFCALLVIGTVNIGVFYWGASERASAFGALQRAIVRQILITDASDRLEDQQQYFDLLPLLGPEAAAAPLSETERARFAESIESIVEKVREMLEQTEPARQDTIRALYEKTERLGQAWTAFFDAQGVDPAQALEALYVRAEPLARDLLDRDFPSAVRYEKTALAELSERFIRTDRFFARIAWISFVLSALAGGLLAFLIARDLLQAISALKVGADRIGAGQLDYRIAIPNRDELGDVAASFNGMAERLEERTAELQARRDEVAAQRDDLTTALDELRETQEQLVQQEKMASLGQLTAGIAHEIKNPLNFVNNFADLSVELAGELAEELDAHPGRATGERGEALKELVEDLKTNSVKIRQHGRRADGIVNAMLEHARDQQGERLPADLNALVEEYVHLAFHGVRAQSPDFDSAVETDYGAAVGAVEVEPQALGRVLLNLLNNAFYAVHARAQQAAPGSYEPTVRVRTRRHRRTVKIRVEDNGLGMSADVQARIFEPFFTTKPTGQGTGLGLSLSYDIVTQRHGGHLHVESTEGEGTAFTVVLPAA